MKRLAAMAKARRPSSVQLLGFVAALLLPHPAVSTSQALWDAESRPGGVQRVLQMLEAMSTDAQEEKRGEELAWAKQKGWCQMRSGELTKALQGNAEELESLGAETDRLSDDVENLGEDLAQISSNVEALSSQLDNATKEREVARLAFEEQEKDFRGSTEALDGAIQKLEERAAGSSFLQLSDERAQLPEKAQQLVTSLLDEGAAPSAPDGPAYEFQSGGIVDMLKKLYDDFKQKLWECQKEDMQAKNAHELVATELQASVSTAEQDQKEKAELKLRKQAKVAENKKRLAAGAALKAENEKSLEETNVDCMRKQAEHQEKHKVLTEEIEAIGKAVEIISSQVQGSAGKLLGGPKATALAMLRSSAAGRSHDVHRQEVRQYLTDQGRLLQSKSLSLLAQQLEADPFAKVKKMIQDMLMKLMDEARQDADEHGFCESELGKNQISRTALSERVETLDAEVEETKAAMKQLEAENRGLAEEVQSSQEAYNQAFYLRREEKEQNRAALKEAKNAQQAVAQAIAVLRKFYAGDVALLQESTAQEGQQSLMQASSGRDDTAVIGMLEIIQSDFSTVEADTKAAEANAQRMFQEMEAQAKEDKAVKEKQMELNTADKANKEASLQEVQEELKNTEIQLDSADKYYAKLQGRCSVGQTETHKDRAEKIKQEVQSLRNALAMLTPEAPA